MPTIRSRAPRCGCPWLVARSAATAAVLTLATAAQATAQSRGTGDTAAGYTLTAWTEQMGVPSGDVLAITEDLDGYLWIGTSSGLTRFDGAVFTPRETRDASPPTNRAVGALVGARDGSLWVGHGGSGGITRVRADQVISYGMRDGLFAGTVAALVEDRAGTIWAGGRGGLSAFRDGRWERIQTSGSYGGAEVFSIYEDRSGRLWLGTSAGVYAGTAGAFELRYPQDMFVQDFAEDLQGTMWVTDTRETIKRLGPGKPPVHGATVRVPQSGWRLASDQRGRIWIAALGGGLLRLADSGTVRPVIERFPYESKIGGSPRTVFFDRDGNLWIGMRGGGLLRVSESSIASETTLDGLTNDGVRAVWAGPDGSMWVATGHGLNRFAGAARQVFAVAQTRAMHADPQGTPWIATARGFGHIENGRFVPGDPASGLRWEAVMAATSDPSDAGAHWLCSSQQGVMVWRNGTISRFEHVPEIASKSCSSLYTDRRGRQWIGFTGGGVAVHKRGAFEQYGDAEGLAGGGVLAILEDRSDDIWVATRSGLSRFQNGRFTTVTRANGPFTDLIAALVQDDDGYLWVGVSSGAAVLRFLPREMNRVAADPSHQVEYAVYDVSDGMQGEIAWQQSRALAARAADGRLWFATGLGLAVIDPRNLPRNQRRVAPRIELVSVDGNRLSPEQQTEFPSSVSNLTVTWGATSLGAASKLRFRYRLEGVDDNWVLAGAQRSISYPRLPSGSYRFRVSATNDGVWTDGMAWAFVVVPPFYRAPWFLALGGFGIAAAVAATWWVRVRTMQERYALAFAERALMSREIHDTLLQSLAAISIELEALARQTGPGQAPRMDALRRLQHQASHSLGEGRDLVVALRQTGISKTSGLVATLRTIAEHTARTRGTQVDVQVTGPVTRCSSDVELQLLRICQEAINNAIVHGRATVIEMTISFRASDVATRVSDNGCGFDTGNEPDAIDGKEHLGLIGMKERAARIGAQITLTSTPGSGTVIETVAPFGTG